MISQSKFVFIFISVLMLILISLLGVFILRDDFANSFWDITLNIALAFLVSWGVFYFQYRASGTRKLVNRTKQATQAIIAGLQSDKYIGDLRNRYRYNLGIAINLLYGFTGNIYPSFLKDVKKGTPDVDRWEFYNEHIRPFYERLSSYDFWANQDLKCLITLCEELENTVALLDAKIQINKAQPSEQQVKVTPNFDVTKIETNDPELIAQYDRLKRAWLDWCKRCSVDL